MFLNEYAGILNGPPGLGAAGQDTASTVENLYASILKRPAYQGEIDYWVGKFGTNLDDAGLQTIKADLIPRGSNPIQLAETRNKVIDLYRTTLKREPTEAEINRWVSAWGISMEGDEYQAFITEANAELAKPKPLTPELATQLMIKAASTALSDTEANEYGGYDEIKRVFNTTGQDLTTLLNNLNKTTQTNLAAQIAVSGVGSLSFMDSTGTQLTQTGLINMINNGIDANSLITIVQNYTNPVAAANAENVVAQATVLAQDNAIATAADNAAYLISQVNVIGLDAPIKQQAITQLSDQLNQAVTLQNDAIQKQKAIAAVAASKAKDAATAAKIAADAKALEAVKQTTKVVVGNEPVVSTTGTTSNLTPLLFLAGAALLLRKI